MASRFLLAAAVMSLVVSASGQERLTSPHSKGGTPLNAKWEGVPAEFRDSLKIPEWPLPTDLRKWERDRVEVRQTLVKLLGDLPPRPDPREVRVVSTEDRGEFTLEKIEFHNGADAIVSGYIMIPKSRASAGAAPGAAGNAVSSRRPCIVLLHEHGYLRAHGIYYFVPGILQHFDTEAIHALVAPRPHLELSGDQDPGAPIDGVETLERKLGAVYRLYGKPENFRSVVWTKTGHEYLPEMRERMIAWFEKHLPVK